MKIYTLSYYSDVINTVLGNYSSFARAKDVLLEEVEDCREVLDDTNCVELHINGYGRYPVKDKAEFHAYYEISCENLDDEEEDDDDLYDEDDYPYDDEDDEDEDEDEDDEDYYIDDEGEDGDCLYHDDEDEDEDEDDEDALYALLRAMKHASIICGFGGVIGE